MFFSLEKTANSRFPYQYQLGQLVLNTDAGWKSIDTDSRTLVYKGYADHAELDSIVNNLPHTTSGNFCVFEYDQVSQQTKVLANQYRGFLIWHQSGTRLSNLFQEDYTIWNDSNIAVDQLLTLYENKVDIVGSIDGSCLDLATAVDQVHELLTNKIKNFVQHNKLPLRVYCSGGIDSMLVYSYIKQFTSNYELILENRLQYDEFWCKNSRLISDSFWGYRQIHHWIDPCVLTSGAPGDEFMLRNPSTTNLWLMYHGTNIPNLLKTQDIKHKFFDLPHNQRMFETHGQDKELDHVMKLSTHAFYHYLCNIVTNDCQHWHLGNTLTFTPLRDLEIFKIFLRLHINDAIPQILSSSISKELIRRNDADLLNYLSDDKDTGEEFANLVGLVSNQQ